jgi:hypothetical protein
MCTTNGGSDDVEWKYKIQRFVVARHGNRNNLEMPSIRFGARLALLFCVFVCVLRNLDSM